MNTYFVIEGDENNGQRDENADERDEHKSKGMRTHVKEMRTQIREMRKTCLEYEDTDQGYEKREVRAIEHIPMTEGDENNDQRDENADGRDKKTRYGDASTGEGDEITAKMRTHASCKEIVLVVQMILRQNSTYLRNINSKGNDSVALTGGQAIEVKTGVRRT